MILDCYNTIYASLWHSSSKGNFFDGQDKTRYRESERDFSNHVPKKRRLHAALSHNFSGDGDVSDVEVSDDVYIMNI